MPDERNRPDDDASLAETHDPDGAELPPPPPTDGVPTADRDRDVLDRGALDRDRIAERDRDLLAERDRRDRDALADRDLRDDRDRIADGDRDDRDRDRDQDGIADRTQVADDEIEVVRTRSFSFGQLVTFVIGGLLVALGVIALIATGLDTPLDQPVEDVLGWNHTPLLGLAEVGAGALLVLFSLRPGGRWFVAVIGVALVVAGVVMAGEADWTVENLGAEQGFGWLTAVVGAVVILAALITPRRHQTVTGVPVVGRR